MTLEDAISDPLVTTNFVVDVVVPDHPFGGVIVRMQSQPPLLISFTNVEDDD